MIIFTSISARAALSPDEVAIIAMSSSEESMEIANYYAKARGISSRNILKLSVKPETDVSRLDWEKYIRPAILRFLQDKKNIRCMVTCWDVPLRIQPKPAKSFDFRDRRMGLIKERTERVAAFEKLIAELDAIGRTAPPAAKLPLQANVDEQSLRTSFNEAMQGVQNRTRSLTSDADKDRLRATLEMAFLKASGTAGMLQMIAPRSKTEKPTPEKVAQQGLFIGLMRGQQQAISAMEGLPDSVARDQTILDLVESKAGLFGSIRWIDHQLTILKRNESGASFDSELSMIFYDDYTSLSQRPNELHYSYDKSRTRRVMMVSRLAAPTVEIVKKMIDEAVATENSKDGLQGVVYIDGRGKKIVGNKGGNTYITYDQSLRDLAARIRRYTTLTVVSDDKEELFQAGNCPNAAIYCGWYSVRQYVDAFDWKPGAVAYHIASFEAKWLRKPPEKKEPPKKDGKPPEKPWCPYMLEDGVCATLGAVSEPYLAAFPLPDDFFPLLLTGKMTIAEVYYRTKRFNSWALVLVGDPLYTPFKNKPAMKEDGLPDRLKQKQILKPSTMPAPAASPEETDAKQTDAKKTVLPQ